MWSESRRHAVRSARMCEGSSIIGGARRECVNTQPPDLTQHLTWTGAEPGVEFTRRGEFRKPHTLQSAEIGLVDLLGGAA